MNNKSTKILSFIFIAFVALLTAIKLIIKTGFIYLIILLILWKIIGLDIILSAPIVLGIFLIAKTYSLAKVDQKSKDIILAKYTFNSLSEEEKKEVLSVAYLKMKDRIFPPETSFKKLEAFYSLEDYKRYYLLAFIMNDLQIKPKNNFWKVETWHLPSDRVYYFTNKELKNLKKQIIEFEKGERVELNLNIK